MGELKPYSEQAQSIKLGYYRHFRNKKYYKFIGLARHSETLEELVVYQPLYGLKELWVRPLKMFAEIVEHEEQERPRFEYLGEEEPAKLQE